MKNFLFGCAYYPEHWDKNNLENDAKNMAELNFNTVRMGEFAFSKFYPSKNATLQTEWLDCAIETLARYGIKTILCTPTATPPKYLFDELNLGVVNEKGEKYGFGSRRQYCVNDKKYLLVCKKVVKEIASYYKNNSNILGFQIDNELGGDHSSDCYCEYCKSDFKDYLKNKFKTIENLNKECGTTAWNQTYTSFDEIDLPAFTQTVKNPHLSLEFNRFQAESVNNFKNIQREIILNENKSWIVCTNIFGISAITDNRSLVLGDSFVAIDNYPNMEFGKPKIVGSAMLADMCYSYLKKPFISIETQCGTPGANILFPTPRPDDIKKYVFQLISHGAKGILFFRYRTNTFGAEQNWHGILNHDGRKNRLFYEIKEMGQLIEKFLPYANKREKKIAIIHNNEINWVFEIQPLMLNYSYYKHVEEWYNACFNLGENVDMISENDDLSEYSLVIVPNYIFDSKQLAEKLESYVKNGGKVIIDYRTGVKDTYNKASTGGLPNSFTKLLGVYISEYGIILEKDKIMLSFPNSIDFKAEKWYDYINTITAVTIANYKGDYLNNTPAITKNKYGDGNAYYVGTGLCCQAMEKLISTILTIKNQLPNDVEIINNENSAILINHNVQDIIIDKYIGEIECIYDTKFNGKLKGKSISVFKKA